MEEAKFKRYLVIRMSNLNRNDGSFITIPRSEYTKQSQRKYLEDGAPCDCYFYESNQNKPF